MSDGTFGSEKKKIAFIFMYLCLIKITYHTKLFKKFLTNLWIGLKTTTDNHTWLFLTSFTLIQNPEAVVNGFVYQTFKYMSTLTGHVWSFFSRCLWVIQPFVQHWKTIYVQELVICVVLPCNEWFLRKLNFHLFDKRVHCTHIHFLLLNAINTYIIVEIKVNI